MAEANIEDKYRAVFKGEFGRAVLGDILARTHWGCTLDPDNKAQIGEFNIGIYILAQAGILQDINKTMLGLIVGEKSANY